MPRWVVMWTIAFAMYGACKWATYWQARTQFVNGDRRRTFGYLLAWPGMDASAFASHGDATPEPDSCREWTFAGLKVLLGVVLTFVVARWAWPDFPLVTGWIVYRIRHTSMGRAMIAVRENELSAASMAQSPRRVKLSAFALSGAIASLAGFLYGGLLINFSSNPGERQSRKLPSRRLGMLSGSVASSE